MSETSDVVTPTIRALNGIPGVDAIRVQSGTARNGKTKLAPAGTPDILVTVRGFAVWMEAKSATGKVSAAQQKRWAELNRAGAKVHLIHSARAAVDIVKNYLRIEGIS